VNFARRVRRKNELSYWSPVSRALFNLSRLFRRHARRAAALSDGPATCASSRSSRRAVRGVGEEAFDRDLTAGVDIKAGITPVTDVRRDDQSDFAQAEADEQQVNLTQFSLFFPEKREFFLENAGIFYFGDIPRNSRTVARFRPP
jgi:hypothetical protein